MAPHHFLVPGIIPLAPDNTPDVSLFPTTTLPAPSPGLHHDPTYRSRHCGTYIFVLGRERRGGEAFRAAFVVEALVHHPAARRLHHSASHWSPPEVRESSRLKL